MPTEIVGLFVICPDWEFNIETHHLPTQRVEHCMIFSSFNFESFKITRVKNLNTTINNRNTKWFTKIKGAEFNGKLIDALFLVTGQKTIQL